MDGARSSQPGAALLLLADHDAGRDEGDDGSVDDTQLGDYEERVRAIQTRYPTPEQQTAALARTLVRLMKKRDDMDAICEDATRFNEDLEAQLAAAADEIDELATAYARLMDEKDALLVENRELAEYNMRLGEDLAVAKKMVIPLQRKLDKATDRARIDAKTLEKRSVECERMLEDRARLRKQVFGLHQELQEAAMERTELEWRLDRTAKQLTSTFNRLEEVKSELRAARSDRNKLMLANERLAGRARDCIAQVGGPEGGETLDELIVALTTRLEHQKERLLAASKERDWFAAQVRSSRLSEDQQVQTLARLELWNDAMRARLLAIDAKADEQLEDWNVLAENAVLRRANSTLAERLRRFEPRKEEKERERMREEEETARMRGEELDRMSRR